MRNLPSISELDALVVAECDKNIQNANMFTAYGITMDLRKANIDIEIDHHEVRSLVQTYMSNVPNYTASQQTWNNSTATTYVPQMAQAQVVSPTQAAIPATSGNPLAQLLATTPTVGMVIPFDDEENEDEDQV